MDTLRSFADSLLLLMILWWNEVGAYYKNYICYGTGDCIITYHTGGMVDDQHRWAVECHDGEAMIGFLTQTDTLWCKFMFPKKKPTFGIYPYYDYCNVRNLAPDKKEFYCYDKYYPSDTYDTFVTAISKDQPSSPGHMMKCCKLPYGYHLDYSRCEYKYNHDKFGELYDEHNMWVCKCDRDFVLTGIGRAINPWHGLADYDYVWAQCCPLFYDPAYVSLFAGPVGNSYNRNVTSSNTTAARRPAG